MTHKERRIRMQKRSDKLVRWIGSPYSLFIHTIFFGIMLGLSFTNIGFDKIMLVLTTIVSLEAIYLSIFIQMTVNKHGEELEEVSGDIDEIQEDVEEIEKDIDEIQKDVDEIQEDVEDIEEEKPKVIFEKIEKNLQDLMNEISELKKKDKKTKIKTIQLPK